MRPDHLLRFDYWLDLSVSAQPAGPAMQLAIAVGALGVVLTSMGLARGWLRRDVAIPWLVAAGLVGLVGLGRLIAHPLLGLRLGWLLAARPPRCPRWPSPTGRPSSTGWGCGCRGSGTASSRRCWR